MRRRRARRLAVFNGRDGEWLAEIAEAGRRGGRLSPAPPAPQRRPPDLWLLFAPLKKARTDFIVEKATELGAARILPVFTRRTQGRAAAPRAAARPRHRGGRAVRRDLRARDRRRRARLDALLDGWDPGRRLMFCDETRGPRRRRAAALAAAGAGAWAVLIGPEGGFAPDEAARLRALPFVCRSRSGPRVLRADTAAVAALALWQAAWGTGDELRAARAGARGAALARGGRLGGRCSRLGALAGLARLCRLRRSPSRAGCCSPARARGCCGGAAAAAAQGRRGRGEGVVVIDEARIAYFGPRDGGFVDLPRSCG